MVRQLLIGSALVIATVFVHALATSFLLPTLRRLQPGSWKPRGRLAGMNIVAILVLLLFLTAVVEVALWAVVYVQVGALAGFEEALYFSMVTFTTLGYGEIVLTERWRLLASFEAATGIIMFGWTTALILAAIQRIASGKSRSKLGPMLV